MPQKWCVPRYMDPKPPERVRSPTNPGTPTPPKESRRDCNDGTGAENHTSASAVVRPKFGGGLIGCLLSDPATKACGCCHSNRKHLQNSPGGLRCHQRSVEHELQPRRQNQLIICNGSSSSGTIDDDHHGPPTKRCWPQQPILANQEDPCQKRMTNRWSIPKGGIERMAGWATLQSLQCHPRRHKLGNPQPGEPQRQPHGKARHAQSEEPPMEPMTIASNQAAPAISSMPIQKEKQTRIEDSLEMEGGMEETTGKSEPPPVEPPVQPTMTSILTTAPNKS